jgi:uncharacterized Fe-S cluster-containing radical SAM superfamily protein
MEITSAAIAFTGLVIGWSLHIAAFVWWLSRQFSESRALIYTQTEDVKEQLREHEKSDERRFDAIEISIAGQRRNVR